MRLRVGTSGYQYKAWRGSLYSEDCKEAEMLGQYAARLATVELNNTFYRMPRREVVERWAEQVPESFRLTIKATRRISHRQRLKESAEILAVLLETIGALGDKRGAVLFQLPPNMRMDLPRLQDFLALLPDGSRAAFEFRHPSWFDEPVFAALRERDAALCIADVDDEDKAAPFVATASWGYLRLRRGQYTEEDVAELASKIGEMAWQEAYAYFKHEDVGPELAARLQAHIPISE